MIDLGPVSSTALLTLYARVIAAGWDPPLLEDPAAAALVARLDEALAGSDAPLHRAVRARDLNPVLVAELALRARHFDRVADTFLEGTPGGLVVELGCGLDTRAERVARGRGDWLAFDLPGVVALREQLLPPNPRRTVLAADLADPAWMDAVAERQPVAPPLFLAEGLLMYLPEPAVETLVIRLAARFPGCVLLADVYPRWAVAMVHSRYGRWKARRQLHLDGGLPVRSGVAGSRAFEGLAPGIRLLDEWSFLDEPDLAPGWLRVMRAVPGLRHVHWAVRYQLGEPGSSARGNAP